MSFTIDELKTSQGFSDIDIHLADMLCGKASESSSTLYLVILLLSARLAQGDVCLLLNDIAGKPLAGFAGEDESLLSFIIPGRDEIISALERSGIAGTDDQFLPVIIDNGERVYFQKYRFFEKSLADSISAMTAPAGPVPDIARVAESFKKLFPGSDGEIDWQGAAAYSSLRNRFTVISGGPGTGKTSTVIRILALLIRSIDRDISIALAAPTGKAAARLRESITLSIEKLPIDDDVKAGIPLETFTIHRLLGSVNGSPEFRHNRENPMRYDVIVVDECSMADLALMYRFFGALKSGARVILLGDRDQLSSVEGGSVFGDICDRGRWHGYTPEFITEGSTLLGSSFSGKTLHESNPAPLSDSMTILRKSYRFSGDSGIGVIADIIRRGDADAADKLLSGKETADLMITGECSIHSIENAFRRAAESAFGRKDIPVHESVLEFIKGFAILTATRRGPAGAAALNLMAERVLEESGVIAPSALFYEGRPVMVTRNDYSLSLFNGDIGVTCLRDGELRVMFEKPDGTASYIHPSRMPEHETAYAVTIHKSQGSEFSEVLVVLPQSSGPIMTRELLYTAVTRGKSRVVIASDKDTVVRMIGNPMKRMTGLRERLWGAT